MLFRFKIDVDIWNVPLVWAKNYGVDFPLMFYPESRDMIVQALNEKRCLRNLKLNKCYCGEKVCDQMNVVYDVLTS
jgi:hypothetical protein